MFCPKCGETLEQIAGVWTCRRGDMSLSGQLSAALADVYVHKIRTAKPHPVTFAGEELGTVQAAASARRSKLAV